MVLLVLTVSSFLDVCSPYILDPGHALTDIWRPNRVCSKSKDTVQWFSAATDRYKVILLGDSVRSSYQTTPSTYGVRLNPKELPLPVQRPVSFFFPFQPFLLHVLCLI